MDDILGIDLVAQAIDAFFLHSDDGVYDSMRSPAKLTSD